MANTLSTKKNIRTSARRTAVNKSRKSRIRTFYRKIEEAIGQNNEELSRAAFREYESELMGGVSKGVYKKNTAARRLKNVFKRVRNLSVKLK
jgi:small subunit ribosomal protein S20